MSIIRGLLREFGRILLTGVEAVTAFSKRHLGGDQHDMHELANGALGALCYQLLGLIARIEASPS